MFLPMHTYARPADGGFHGGAALLPGSFAPPMAAGGHPPLVLAPGFAPGLPPPLIEREPVDVCKLFVGGLSPSTTEADIEEHFKEYGAVRSSVVMFDKKLNRSRCFGFVTYTTEKEAMRAYVMGPHTIGGNEVELRRAVPRTTFHPGARGGGLRGLAASMSPSLSRGEGMGVDGIPPDDPEDRECKVFIGGIPNTMSTEDIRAFFTKRFGMVKRVDFFYDKVTGRMRGFGFLIFSFPHSAKMAVGHHLIGDVTIEVKKAVEKEEMRHQKETDGVARSGPRRMGAGPPGVLVRPLRPFPGHAGLSGLLDFVPYEVALPPPAGGAPVVAGARHPPALLQDPYAAMQPIYHPHHPHHAAAAGLAVQGAGGAPPSAGQMPAYGNAFLQIDPQHQSAGAIAAASGAPLAYACGPGGGPPMFMPPGYGYAVVPSGGAEMYGAAGPMYAAEQSVAAAADPYDPHGPLRTRPATAKVPASRAQPY